MKKKVLITGGTGFIGRFLVERLLSENYEVTILTRNLGCARVEGVKLIASLEEVSDSCKIYAIINLAGEPLAKNRWTRKRKDAFLSSRLAITGAIIELMARLRVKPKVFLSSSAIGYYGPQDDKKLNEEAPPVNSFSHTLCAKWEACANKARAFCPRVCLMRIGVVFAHKGGPLEVLSRPFKLKMATQLGSGAQWISWIHIDDVVNGMVFLLQDLEVEGPVNFTTIEPVTNAQLTSLLGRKLKAWIKVVVPRPLLRVMVGEMADEVLLTGQRVVPEKLTRAGFMFKYPRAEEAVKAIFY